MKKSTFGDITQQSNGELTQAIHSNARKYVESQMYLFEALWKNAIPVKQRIREIEQGAKREVIEIIRDPAEIQKISYQLIKSAKKEILLIFSTAIAFNHQVKEASTLLQLLKEVTSSQRVKIRILVLIEEKTINEVVRQLQGLDIVVRDNKIPVQAPIAVTTLVVDQLYSLRVELQDGTKQELSEEEQKDATALATYSNSQSTALSYFSIFETLWMQNEIYHPGRHISWRQF